MGELRLRGKTWWIRYYRGGVRYEESSGSAGKQAAIDLLKIREGDSARGIPVTPKVARLRFDEAAADVVTDYRINGRRSLAHVERRITKHLTPFFGGRRMSAITTATVRTFIAERQAADASNAEINRELAILKRAFRLAVQGNKLLFAPHVPMLAENNVRQGFFERTEFEDVRKQLPEDLRGVVTFAYLTGWRIRSEVLSLTWAQVDRKAKTVRLEPGQTKNREGRNLPYSLLPELATVIDAQWASHEQLKAAGAICPMVFHRGGAPIATFQKAWSDARTDAGCPGKLLHDFRRTAVRNLVRAGVPERTAMMVTGHKTRSVFDRYDIVNETDLREAMGRLSEVGTKQGQSRGQARVTRFNKRR